MNLKNGKNIKKKYKIGIIAVLATILLPALFYGLFLIPYIQSKLADVVVFQLSKKFDTEITIDKARIKPFHKISLYNVLIKDRENDTLLYVSKLDASFDILNIKKKYIHISKIDFDSPHIKIVKKDTVYNFTFLLDHFKKKNKNAAKTWDVNIFNVHFNKAKLSFTKTDSTTGTESLSVTNTDIDLNVLKLDKDSVQLKINGMSFSLDNGFTMENATSDILFSDGNLQLNNCYLKSKNSFFVIDRLSGNIDSLKSISKNSGNTSVNLKVKQGSISDKDIKFFVPGFEAFKGNLRFSGGINGKISNLKGKNLNIEIGRSTKLKLNFSIDGLPDTKEAFLFVDIKSFSTDVADLQKILKGAGVKKLVLPEALSKLGTIRYKGNLTGFFTDLVAYGTLNTNLGKITTDLGLKKDENDDHIYFAGNIATQQFNIGKLSGFEKNVGNLTMNMTIKGSRSPKNIFMVFLEGNVDSLYYNRHQYKNIYLSGLLANQHFNGNIFLRDPNGMLNFNGRIDFSKNIPEFDFSATLEGVKLKQFNVLKHLPDGELSLKIETNIKGITIEDLVGYIRVEDISLLSKENTFTSDSIILVAERLDTLKHIILESDLLEGELTGTYNFRVIKKSINKILYNFMPALKNNDEEYPASVVDINDFSFMLNFKKMHDLVNLLLPKADISDEGMIMGTVNTKQNYIDIEGELGKLNYGNLNTEKLSVYINSRNDKSFRFITRFRSLNISKTITFDNLSIHQKAYNDTLKLNIFWNNWDEQTNSGSLFTVTHFTRNKRGLFSAIDINPSQIIVGDSLWSIQSSKVFLYPEGFSVKNFRLWSNNQQVVVNGFQQKAIDDSLNIFIDNINIGGVLRNQKVRNLDLNGRLNSEIHIHNLSETPIITSDININDFVVNKDTLGEFRISSKFDPSNKKLNILTSVDKGSHYTLYGKGDLKLDDLAVNMKFDLDSLPVAFLNMYLGHIMQDIRGTTSGEIFIKGTAKKPELTGRIKANSLKFDIDLLKTTYSLSDSMIFEPHKMIFKNMTVTDKYNHKGTFRGTITHNMFRDMTYNLYLEAKNTQVLNTTEKDNEIYYGTAFADGNMSITGTTTNIKIDIVGKSTPNTQIFIPLEDNGSAQETNFIRFTGAESEKSVAKKETEYHINVSGLDITMDLEITPDARIQVIFDSKVGDILKGTGNGDLRIRIDKTGSVFFYGEYTIEEGDYMFTLQNLLNKRFTIDNGSTIRWDGSPYNALIDLTATYKLKASLYDLVAPTVDPSTSSEFQKRIPINVKLNLTGRLLKPNIRFEIITPSVNNSNQNIIDEYIATEEELNRQVLSLLVMNRFYAPENVQSTAKVGTNAAVVTTTEMLSNQLSNWLSQISNDVDIGVSYRPGDEITSNEIELALSTKMFNNWVTVSSNVGYGNYQTDQTSNIIGDFDVEVKLNKKGTIRAKAYTHSNTDIYYYDTSPTTQGVGISFNEEFNTFHELMQKYWNKLTGKNRKNKKEKKEKKEKSKKEKAIIKNENKKTGEE